MAVAFTNLAETVALKNFLNIQPAENITIKLYSNNRTPGHGDVLSNYTEVIGGGYAAIPLAASSWSVSTGDPSQAQYPQISFAFTGSAGNVYGYYAVGVSSNTLLWADKFPNAPIVIANNGDQIKVTITVTLNNP